MNPDDRFLLRSWILAMLAALFVGCASTPEAPALVDGPVRKIVRGEVLDPSGDTVPLSSVEGWYLLSPARLEKILLKSSSPE